MPGKNSLFQAGKQPLIDRIIFQNAYILISVVIVVVELVGMYRGYYAWVARRHSLESYTMTIFFVFCDIQILTGLFKSHNADPGYIVPER